VKLIPAQYKELALTIGNASNSIWETFADIDGDNVPNNDIDALQVKLCRWQRRNFGDVSPVDKVDLHMSLGVIEELGETLSTPEIFGDKGMLDGIGDVCVYSGQLLNGNRLAIRPVMDFADVLAADWDNAPNPEEKPDGREGGPAGMLGRLAHVVLKHDQKIRGFDKREVWQPSLVYALACIMGWAKLDTYHTACEVVGDGATMPKWEQLLQRTYIDVGTKVVLKRNWTVDRVAGQTSA